MSRRKRQRRHMFGLAKTAKRHSLLTLVNGSVLFPAMKRRFKIRLATAARKEVVQSSTRLRL